MFNRRAETRARQLEHAEATSSCIKLGLQRFEHAYGRKKARKSIPPGYFDVAYTGLKAAVKEAGEIAARRYAAGLGRLVDPNDSNAGTGTANIGFGHAQSIVATDLTPFGHHRAFLMHMFSGALRIAGGDVKLMLDMHCHAFEPCAFNHSNPFSTHVHHQRCLEPHHAYKLAGSRRSRTSCCCAAARVSTHYRTLHNFRTLTH